MTLGVFGPWQIIAILIFLIVIVAPIVVLIVVFSNRAKLKAQGETLDAVSQQNQKKEQAKFDELERLNKLRKDVALTDEEFEVEKKKILK